MDSVRRFLVLTPVAFGVTAVIAIVYLGVFVGPSEIGVALLYALSVAVAVLVVVLVAVGVLRLLGVRGAWAALGVAFALVAVGCAVRYVADRPWVSDDEEWDLLLLTVAAVASLPTWLTFAVGLLIGDRRARNRAVSATP